VDSGENKSLPGAGIDLTAVKWYNYKGVIANMLIFIKWRII